MKRGVCLCAHRALSSKGSWRQTSRQFCAKRGSAAPAAAQEDRAYDPHFSKASTRSPLSVLIDNGEPTRDDVENTRVFAERLDVNGSGIGKDCDGELEASASESLAAHGWKSDGVLVGTCDPVLSVPGPRVDLVQAVDGVTIVRDARSAARALLELTTTAQDSLVAWDTETTGVDPTEESPAGKGRAICLSAYGGEHLDFGNGPRLFVDVLNGEGGDGLLQVFRGYFESEDLYKVWHNYSFDRHILNNHGINVAGFGGDTMHMARLVDTSRKRYSLEELCKDFLGEGLQKGTMKERFGAPRVLKDGSSGKEIVVPPTIELHCHPKHARAWIDYAVSDAELTHRLTETLHSELMKMQITEGGNALPDLPYKNMRELYEQLFVPFGNMLIDMERTGFRVDVQRLQKAQVSAEHDRDELEDQFRAWASRQSADAKYMNVNSGKQKQHLFFAPCRNSKLKEELPREKEFVVEQTGVMRDRYEAELRALEEERSAKFLNEASPTSSKVEGKRQRSVSSKRPRPKKLKKKVLLSGLGLPPSEFTASGWPSVDAEALRKLAGKPRADPPVYGDAQDPGTCLAIDDIMEASAISTLLSGFIMPLQNMVDANGRIHASLNLNTETGRLSSRRPNLQNQPALEKDRYKIRDAFVCEPGNSLIVADYGQLELRLLAHITGCKSMIDAFEAGGDFHSRTALGMYDYVAAAINRGDCLLEWSGNEETSPEVPLLKDMFPTERRRAKTLNFSIAYGKTAVGLARDWGISVDEAKDTLELWYRDRQEVKRWQERCRTFARKHKFVETILGRRRHLPGVSSSNLRERGHAERAAINAPLQGSAADLVMVAMIKLHNNPTLRALGWRVVLQIHDEIILEGSQVSSDIACKIVQDVMLQPLGIPLGVAMTVDPSVARSWFEAK